MGAQEDQEQRKNGILKTDCNYFHHTLIQCQFESHFLHEYHTFVCIYLVPHFGHKGERRLLAFYTKPSIKKEKRDKDEHHLITLLTP